MIWRVSPGGYQVAVTFAWKTRVLSSGQMRSVISPRLFIILCEP